MDMDTLQAEYFKIWRSTSADRFEDAKVFELDEYLAEAYGSARKQASDLMPIHLVFLEKAVTCLILLSRFVSETKMSTQSAAYLSQLHRSVNCIIAIRHLLLSGLEETCRSVTRNYFESLDISTACLVDSEFAKSLFGDERADFDILWKEKIGYGKVYKYIMAAFELAGIPQEEAEDHIRIRKAQKSLLSESVHADGSGAFRSMAPPPLGYPDMVSTEPHGVISFHTANHAAEVISETLKYLSLVIKVFISEKLQPTFNLPRDGENMHTLFSHYLAFQEIFYRYDLPDGEKIIAPDYNADA